MKRRLTILAAVTTACLLVCGPWVVRFLRGDLRRDTWVKRWKEAYNLSADARTGTAGPAEVACLIVEGARQCARKAARYDASYRSIAYPMGDVPDDRGACSDVIVRSLRAAGVDLQVLIHEDMRRNFSAYPRLWGLSAPDPNIDHRRVPNQMCYMLRHWERLSTHPDAADWLPGDLVYWRLLHGRLHCGVVTDGVGSSGRPTVVHNMGVCGEEDCLGYWPIVAHFRYPGAHTAQ